MEKQSEKKDGEIPTMKSIITKDELNLNSDEISVGVIDESMLSEEEKEKVERISSELNIEDVNQVINFGNAAQQNISDFSSSILKKVKNYDLGEIGDSLKELTIALDATTEKEKKGLLGLVQKAKRGVDSIRANYTKAENNVNRIEKDLQQHQSVLSTDIMMYQQMYELNIQYYRELTLYILAGKKALSKAKSEKLQQLKKQADASGMQEDVQIYRDYEDLCHRFEKKLNDLEITRVISIQSAPQVRMLQNNDREMLDKLQSSLANTIPLWRNQLVLSLGIEHTRKALEAQSTLADKTNELLRKNSETLKMATVETAKQAERSIVDIETLKQCNKDLITTINDVLKIHKQGEEKREKAQIELTKIEEELKQVMMENSK
ncbi:toxic anion resistance protein [Eubacterium ventriosum]|uniref:toxic anion resistance protein n=1 Tax=Eubacterium ventriosum TaxID=39496 RepID=UPI003521F984